MAKEKWVKVYTDTDVIKINILKGLLTEHDIESIIFDKKDSMYQFGEVELHVQQEHAIKAIRIIEKTEHE